MGYISISDVKYIYNFKTTHYEKDKSYLVVVCMGMFNCSFMRKGIPGRK